MTEERLGQVIGWKFLCPCLSFPSLEWTEFKATQWQPCASPLCDTSGYALEGRCGGQIRRSLSRLVAQAKLCRLELHSERLRLPWVLKIHRMPGLCHITALLTLTGVRVARFILRQSWAPGWP